MCHDLSEELSHGIQVAPGQTPTMLQCHHLFLAKQMRLITGLEQLVILGHPRDIVRTGISDRQLSQLAGNTRTVQFLCAEITLLLLAADFKCHFNPGHAKTASLSAVPKRNFKRGRPSVESGDFANIVGASMVRFGPHAHTDMALVTKVRLPYEKGRTYGKGAKDTRRCHDAYSSRLVLCLLCPRLGKGETGKGKEKEKER